MKRCVKTEATVHKWFQVPCENTMCCLCENCHVGVTQFITSPSEETRQRRKLILNFWQLPGSVLSRCFFTPLGDMVVMKALEDE